METTIAVELIAPGGLEGFLNELTASLATSGLRFEPGPAGRITEGETEVGRVVEWVPGERAVLEWHGADWAPDDVTEVEIRADADRIRIEHRGFGRQFWADEDAFGWFADQIGARFLAAAAPRRLGDWLTDRSARRPFGIRARRDYQDPTHHRPSFGAVLAVLDLQKDDVLLEVGCGGGAFLAEALARGCRAAAIDHSPEMVRTARELNAAAVAEGRLEVVEGSAESLPFDDDSFTCAAMMQVFFFFPDPAAVLGECRRVIRPGGRLAVFTVSAEAKGTPAAPEPMASRGYFHSDAELVELARGAGFADPAVEHPELEPYARAAGLPEDVVALFAGDPGMGQLLLARG